MKLNDADKIYIGNTAYDAVYIGSTKVWPYGYTATLTVSRWAYGGQYSLSAIPAAGGSATPTWTLTILQNGSAVATRNVTSDVSITIEEYINGNWVTAQNFSYSNGHWYASDRGRNGLSSSSGSQTPSSAPARNSRIRASYSGTYSGQSVGATSEWYAMTQNANNVRVTSDGYANMALNIGDYSSISDAAPAYYSTTSITATLDRETDYQFYDGTTGATGLTYSRTLEKDVKTNSFSFSVPQSGSWVSVSNKTSSGATVEVASRGTVYSTSRRNTTITASYTDSGGSTYSDSVYVYQAANLVYDSIYNYTRFEAWTSPSSLDSDDTSFSVYGTIYYNYKYQYDSLEWDDEWRSDHGTVQPTITDVDSNPSVSGIDYSGNSVTVPTNTGSSEIEYTATVTYTDDNGGEWDGYTASITQSYVSYTYDTPVVTVNYATIGAAELTGYPVVTVSQNVYQGGTLVDTLIGSLSDGETSGTAYGNNTDLSASFSVSYSGSAVSGTGASFDSSDGGVTTETRGTTTGGSRTVAQNIYATVTMDNGETGNNTQAASATQSANSIERTEPAVYSSCRISNISPSHIYTYSSTEVEATVRATYTTEKIIYTSYDDGDANGYTGGVTHTDESVTATTLYYRKGSSGSFSELSDTNSFYAENTHTTDDATWYVKAAFHDAVMSDGEAVTVGQDSDVIVANARKNFWVTISIDSDSVWAGGGDADVSYEAGHTNYSYWQSGGSSDVVDGSESTVDTDPVSIELVDLSQPDSASGVFGLSGSTVSHRDMMKVTGTDTVKVQATNTSPYASSSTTSSTDTLTAKTGYISASNELGSTPYVSTGNLHHGSQYAGNYRVTSFTADDYTDSGDQAPFAGATTPYSVSAVHDLMHVDTWDIYTDYRYSSWSAGNDDNNHRERTTTQGNQTYVDSTVTGDSYTITTSEGWLSTSGGNIVIAAQQSGGQPRYGQMQAVNNGGGAGYAIGIYQYGYAAISASTDELDFNSSGTTLSFTITSEYTGWNISYDFPTTSMPTLSFSPSSGGSVSSPSTTTTVYVTAGMNDQQIFLRGTFYIEPTAPGFGPGATISIMVLQEPA